MITSFKDNQSSRNRSQISEGPLKRTILDTNVTHELYLVSNLLLILCHETFECHYCSQMFYFELGPMY